MKCLALSALTVFLVFSGIKESRAQCIFPCIPNFAGCWAIHPRTGVIRYAKLERVWNGAIVAYDVRPDNTVANPRIFATLRAGFYGGFRCDTHGNVWTSASGGVHCYAPEAPKSA
jgi:hypothetical protein